jgi:hypothetical protein
MKITHFLFSLIVDNVNRMKKKSVTAYNRDIITRSLRHWLFRHAATQVNPLNVPPYYYAIIIMYNAPCFLLLYVILP